MVVISRGGSAHGVFRTLALLYSNQRGMVVDGCVSKPFEIRRGTKQGDPLSPALFNAVLQKALQEIIPVWNKRGCGIQLGAFGNRGRLCNLRFADDLLIIATSKRQLAKMLQELVDAVGRVGLVMHAGKTKILTNVNNEHRSGQKHILINGQQVDVLPREASTMYSDGEEEASEEGCSEQVDDSDDECDEDGLETWTDWIRRVTHRAE